MSHATSSAHSSDGEYASDFDDLSAGAMSPQRSVVAVENAAQPITVAPCTTDKTAYETGSPVAHVAPKLGESLQQATSAPTASEAMAAEVTALRSKFDFLLQRANPMEDATLATALAAADKSIRLASENLSAVVQDLREAPAAHLGIRRQMFKEIVHSAEAKLRVAGQACLKQLLASFQRQWLRLNKLRQVPCMLPITGILWESAPSTARTSTTLASGSSWARKLRRDSDSDDDFEPTRPQVKHNIHRSVIRRARRGMSEPKHRRELRHLLREAELHMLQLVGLEDKFKLESRSRISQSVFDTAAAGCFAEGDYFILAPRLAVATSWFRALENKIDDVTAEQERFRMRMEEDGQLTLAAELRRASESEAGKRLAAAQARACWLRGVQQRSAAHMAALELESNRQRTAESQRAELLTQLYGSRPATARSGVLTARSGRITHRARPSDSLFQVSSTDNAEVEERKSPPSSPSAALLSSQDFAVAADGADASQIELDAKCLTPWEGCRKGCSVDRLHQLIEEEADRRWHQEGNDFDVNEVDPVDGAFMLHTAAWHGQTALVCYLLAAGADPDLPDSCVLLQTPLHYAARAGRAEVIDQLIAEGADPSFLNGQGDTPLHVAARGKHVDAVKALLPCITRPEPENPLERALANFARRPTGLSGNHAATSGAQEFSADDLEDIQEFLAVDPLGPLPGRWQALVTRNYKGKAPVHVTRSQRIQMLIASHTNELQRRRKLASKYRPFAAGRESTVALEGTTEPPISGRLRPTSNSSERSTIRLPPLDRSGSHRGVGVPGLLQSRRGQHEQQE